MRAPISGLGHALLASIAALTAMSAPADGWAQIPDTFTNLEVLPADISRDSLIAVMRSFSFATGLRCEDCHVLGEGNSFQGARFELDDKLDKRKARYMLRMVETLNRELLPGLPERDQPPLAVECKTCHRGLAKPFLLRTELRRVLEEDGVDAAVARYRELRETSATAGAYDFGEWEMNELAREVAAAGDTAAAASLLELNEEFHAASASIPATLGSLYEALGRTDDAVAAYRRALERNPQNRGARARLEALTGRPPG